ncbi:hypothetical protein ABVK25_010522 [Lepraria finkii]|uniref:AMP-dependent synthetase/ligase domain-containing protein n=1 Tax=Lepraria finkii TaxID=1340010 RepID=A0ABR4AUT9_9LECA
MALPNSYELIVSFLSITRRIGIAAPLNTNYKGQEFEFYIKDMGTAAILIPRGSYEKEIAAVTAARTLKAAIAEYYWDGQSVVLDVKKKGGLTGKEYQDIETANESDVALILHTSRTTGASKAVPLTHKNLIKPTGRAAEGVELDDNGDAVARGEEGEECIGGENVMHGYLSNPIANASFLTNTNFFRTGDLGKLDEDGYLTLTGRIKDIINK